MQHFRDGEKRTTDNAPLYDNESTRNILARAAQIEAESVLTAKQVEALGVELGLSPESVRQALGEAASTNKDVATVARSKWPMTRQEFGSALIPAFLYVLLCFPLMFAARQFMPTFAGPSLFFLVGTAVPGMLAFRFGYRMRRDPVASFGGMLTMLIVSPIAALGMITAAPPGMRFPWVLIPTLIFYGCMAGTFGVAVRKCLEFPAKRDTEIG